MRPGHECSMGTGPVAAALSRLASCTTQAGWGEVRCTSETSRLSLLHVSAEVGVALPTADGSAGLEGASAGEAPKTGGVA